MSSNPESPREELRRRARELRRRPTGAEAVLRDLLRRSGERRIRRQLPVGGLIIDLAVPPRNLLIEVDGGYHAAQAERDRRRDAWLRSLGFELLRASNEEVLTRGAELMARIAEYPAGEEQHRRFHLACRTARQSSYKLNLPPPSGAA